MRIALFTNEYPPNVYGGAGVHVEYLSRELARLDGGAHDVQVLSFGAQTWPHQMVRIMLGEQLYRATTILSGHPYHRA